jgi:beta-galactosidase
LATFLDKYHEEHPDAKLSISEYGAGASIYHQQDSLKQPIPTSYWHPENWQTFYHMENWKIINERPFVWGSFIWNMFDFGAANRTEGDRPGINDKGLVTRDRKVCKDAFYFYKANWNEEPMVYIEGRRNTLRLRPQTEVMVFSNASSVTLSVNNRPVGTMTPDKYHICRFPVTLEKGVNVITAIADGLKDYCEWTLQ